MNTAFLDAAQAGFDQAMAYYEEERSGLGFDFAEEVEQALERIKLYPKAWSPLSLRLRRCVVNRFPYSVLYEIRSEIIIIVPIQHHHQRPESWRSRITE
jgi:ParE toxin of type II toxin-antitoxin system, parDE